VLAGGTDIYLHHAADTGRYAIDRSAPPALSVDAWSTTGWQSLPVYRIDLTGEMQEPLTVQWAGGLPALRDKLTAAGWKVPAPWKAVDALRWLTTTGAPADLPVVPQFAGGRLPGLTLVRPSGPDSRLVLRLWATDIAVSNGETGPLWIGSVVEERLYRQLSLFSWARMGQSFDAPRDAVAEALPDGRLLPRSAVGPDQGWDGRVLLAGAPGLAPR
jgi:undecaprenyl-diphosphatase